jgi:3-methyladenine DNA glycosylase Tag
MVAMSNFDTILAEARARAGGAAALEQRLPEPKSPDELRALGDDRYLSLMSLRVFRAGLKHSMVDAKWPAFEAAFHGFQPRRIQAMNDEDMDALMGDRRLIRHGGKLRSVRDNAAAIALLAQEAGAMGDYLADWPGLRVVELWADMAKRFKQMGGNSGPYFLRMAGKDTFLLTDYVVRALNHWGAVEGVPKGKAARGLVQEAFNRWAAETGRPLCQLSMILARSID